MANEVSGVSRSAPLRDQVYDVIESMIVHHALAPGEKLVEADLAERLNVSRNPVREALTGLSRAGWVVFRPYAGAFVAEQTLEDAEDCFRVRAVLEAEAARAAAERVRDGVPDALQQAADLKATLDDTYTTPTTKDGMELIEANARFHAQFAKLADNNLLREFAQTLEKRVTWFYGTVGFSQTSHSWQEHAALLDAVLAGEPKDAAERMTDHIERTSDAIRERWTTSNPTP